MAHLPGPLEGGLFCGFTGPAQEPLPGVPDLLLSEEIRRVRPCSRGDPNAERL
jgi:hypothetical protein